MIAFPNIPLLSLIGALILSQSVCAADANDASVKVKWGYKGNIGPAEWGQLSPSFGLCASGRMQSPINITKRVVNAKNDLTFHYQPNPMIIMNDGETHLTIGNTQTIINDGHAIQLNFPIDQPKEWINLNGNEYRLVQFHLHSPSENQWHGQSFPLEIHFVHQGEGGKVAVIGVFVKAGKSNKILQNMIDHLPPTQGQPYRIQGERLNPADLLPAKQAYYTFSGSLTTPPCSEGVEWIVMSTPMTATPAQIVALRKAANGANARPVQPLHERVISAVRE